MQPSGSEVLDELLSGGLERGILHTIYGPSGSGKSNIAMLAALHVAKEGKTVIFMDTEASFSALRAIQINPAFDQIADRILFLRPTNFSEQKEAFARLESLLSNDSEGKVGLIVVDSIAMLYRLEMGMSRDIASVNRELGVQLGKLTELARKKNIPVLITNQVYADFENKDAVNMVGGDLLKYSSKCLLELKRHEEGVREISVVKHRSLPEGKSIKFTITQEGLSIFDETVEETSSDEPKTLTYDVSTDFRSAGDR